MIQPQARIDAPAPVRDAVHRIREIGLVAVLAWAPLPFGSARPWAWDLLGILALALLGLSAAYETMRPSRAGMLTPLLPALVMGGLVMGWIVFQALPWNLFGLHHPLWDRASEVLGRPLATSLSIDREASRVHLFRLMTYAAFFIVAWQVGRRPEAAYRLLRAFAVIATVYALYGLVEFVSPDPRILWFIKEAYVTDVTATFVNRNSFATFAGLAVIAHLVLIADLLARKTDMRSRRSFLLSLADSLLGDAKWLVLGLVVCGGALLMSHSRGGLISALAAVAVLMALILAAPAARAPWRLWFAGIGVTGLALVVVLTGATTFDRLDAMSNDLEMRPKIAAAVLRAIGDNWPTGTGYGSFGDIFLLYQPLNVIGNVGLAHNDYLENALELGVPAAALLVAAVLYLAGLCLVGVFRRRRDVIYPLAGTAATVMVGVHSAFDFSLQIPAVTVTYAVMLGIGVAQSTGTRAARSSRPNPR
ncbi:MAG TPA: O-antigen ligase family protein [Alphaproteobacteria bacterium]|jgi:O-antigen ligase|nr:O-antigen ligase family protein [Alphaproteobacteria bacterium]